METKKRSIQDVEEDQVEESRGLLSSIGNSIGQLFGFRGAKRRKTTREDPNKDNHATSSVDHNKHPSPPATTTPEVDSGSKDADTNGIVREEKEVKSSPHEPALGSLPYYRTGTVNASNYSLFSSSVARTASSTAATGHKSIRFQEANLKSTPGQMKYKKTPFKKQLVSFESTGSTQTPHKAAGTMTKQTFVKTPHPIRDRDSTSRKTLMDDHEHTMAPTPFYTPKYKANARSISLLTASSSHRKDSQQQPTSKDNYTLQVVRDILDKSNTAKVYESDAMLFSPPQAREKIKATRIYGRNQSGSRMIQPLKISPASASTTTNASATTPSSRKDYWSRISENALPTTSHDGQIMVTSSTTPRMDETVVTETSAPAPSSNDISPKVAFKRSRVEFTQPDHSFVSLRKDTTPPRATASSKASSSSISASVLKAATPTKADMVVEYVQSPNVAFPRKNTGTINYPNVKMYGQEIVLGESSKGVTTDEIRMEDIGKRIRSKTKFYFRKNGTTNAPSAKPFDSMPLEKNGDGSKKGSSSILHQPLQILSKLKEKESGPAPAASTGTDMSSTGPVVKDDASSIPSASGWGNIFASQKDKHKCTCCSSQYDKNLSKCPACETPNDLQESEKAVESSAVSTSGWGNIFASQKDKHKCASCSSQYDKNLSKCPACETPKESGESGKEKVSDIGKVETELSSSAKPSFSFGSTVTPAADTTTKVPITGEFSFGAAATQSAGASSAFTFGAVPSPAPVAPSSGFTFGAVGSKNEETSKSTEDGFAFSAPFTSDAKIGEESKPAVASFSFGTAPASSDSKKSNDEAAKPNVTNFTFGASSSTTTKSEENKPDVTRFTFGAPNSSTADTNKDAGSKAVLGAFSFGSTAPSGTATGELVNGSKPTASIGFSFGSSTASLEKKEEPTSKRQRDDSASTPTATSVSFGSSPAPAPSFSFGAPSTQETKPTSSSSSMENEAKPVTTAAPFTFGSSSGDDKKSLDSSSIPKFTFGSSTNTEQGIGTKPASTGFTFGSASTNTNQNDTSKSTSAPSFTFGAGSSAAPASSTPTFTFGSAATPAPPASAPAFSFGSSSQAGPSPAPSFSFGSSAGTTPTASSAFNSSTPTPSFSFGAPSAQVASATSFSTATPASAMSFGTNPPPAAPAPFAFGVSNPTTSTSGPTFGGFGSGAPSPVPPFGNPSSAPAPAFAGFGAPMQQQPQGGGFAPGLPAAPAAGGFNIGTGGGSKQSTARGGRRVIRAKRPPSNR